MLFFTDPPDFGVLDFFADLHSFFDLPIIMPPLPPIIIIPLAVSHEGAVTAVGTATGTDGATGVGTGAVAVGTAAVVGAVATGATATGVGTAAGAVGTGTGAVGTGAVGATKLEQPHCP